MYADSAPADGERLGRAELFAIVLVLALLNSLAGKIAGALAKGPADALLSLLGVNAVLWLAIYALIRFGLDARFEPLRPADKWLAGVAVLLCFVPILLGAAAALFLLSLYLLRSSEAAGPIRKLAIVGLAATGPVLWGPLCLELLAPEITRVEALLILASADLPVQDNVFRSAGGMTFVIQGGCSSLKNISFAILLLVALAQLLDIPLTRRLIPIAIAAVAATILVNTARLTSYGYFPEEFAWLHYGDGRLIFAWATLLLTFAIIGFGLLRAAPSRL